MTIAALLFRRDRRKFVRFADGLESVCFMRCIAEWFSLALSAAAKRNARAAVQIVPVAVHIDDLDLFAFHAKASVVIDDDLHRHYRFSFDIHSERLKTGRTFLFDPVRRTSKNACPTFI